MINQSERERYRKIFKKMSDHQLIKQLKTSEESVQYLLGGALSDEYDIQEIIKEELGKRGVNYEIK